MKIPITNIKGAFSTFALTISLFFFMIGLLFFNFSDVTRDFYYIPEKYEETAKIDFEDPDIHLEWMKNLVISQTDDDPLEVGQDIGIHSHIETKQIPKEAAVHIYHEDMKDYFFSNEKYAFRQITNELDKVLTLRYGDVYSIEFDLTGNDVTEGSESFTLNGFESFTFQKSGTYYAIVSMKIQNGSIVHYPSITSVMKIKDFEEKRIYETLKIVLKNNANQKADAYLALALSVTGIGFGSFFVGINFWFGAVTKKEIEIRSKNKSRLSAIAIFPIIMIFGFYVISISSGASLMIITIFLTLLGMIAIQIAFPKTSSTS